jgi:hypothetical protein
VNSVKMWRKQHSGLPTKKYTGKGEDYRQGAICNKTYHMVDKIRKEKSECLSIDTIYHVPAAEGRNDRRER